MRLVKSRFSGTRKVSKTKKTGCLAGLHFFAQCFDCVKYLGFRFAGVKKAVMINQRCDTVLSSRITLNADDFSRAIYANALRHGDLRRQCEGKFDRGFACETLVVGKNK